MRAARPSWGRGRTRRGILAMRDSRDERTCAPGRGRLRKGNLPGNPNTAPRCGAKTRRGTSCRGPAMKNGRCRMHGGASTGPRTSEGLARSRRANWKHGLYSQKAKVEWRLLRELLAQWEEFEKQLETE